MRAYLVLGVISLLGVFHPAEAQELDSTDLFIRRQEAILHRRRVELSATGWRRFLPAARIHLAMSSRNVLFAPAIDPQSEGAALWQPTGAWTLSLSWRLDDLIDPLPRRRVMADILVAETNMASALHEHLLAGRESALQRAFELAQRQLEAQVQRHLLEVLDEKRIVQQDLLNLAELKYEQGEIAFESLASARLTMLELIRQIALTEHSLQIARMRLELLSATHQLVEEP